MKVLLDRLFGICVHGVSHADNLKFPAGPGLSAAALVCAAALFFISGCTVEEIPAPEVEDELEFTGTPVEVSLGISVGGMSVDSGTKSGGSGWEDGGSDGRTKAGGAVEDNEMERHVSDIWIFQYDRETERLVWEPQFVEIADQGKLDRMLVRLSDNGGRPCIVYVVANTFNGRWAVREAGHYAGFATLGELKHQALPVQEPLFAADGFLAIPMGGSLGEDGSLIVANRSEVDVTIRRMYAKVMIGVELGLEDSEIYNIGVGNIPQYCRVASLEDDLSDDTEAAAYPDGVWVSRTFWGMTDDAAYPYVIYVPENLQGRQEAASYKSDPSGHALAVNLVVTHTDERGGTMQYPYTFYPGADTESDYNIRRNHVYRVRLKIDALSSAIVASANSFVAAPGETVAFYPYYRTEQGGGFNFSDYLDPAGETGQKIATVEILWQTKDCIGDNTDGSLVGIYPNEQVHNGYEKIYVKTQKEGNAVVAARNAAGDIIWSWHIWVTEGDPANEANALTYYTYSWDETGIHYDRDRISGTQIMRRNLGAMADEPVSASDPGRTYGLLYQWGRKDPFPPLTDFSKKNNIGKGGYYQHDYDADHTETVYGNDNSTVGEKTAYTDPTNLFHSISGADINDEHDGMSYTIAHPTVFMCGTKEVAKSLSETDKTKLNYVNKLSSYVNGGAWSEDDHVNTLWGGLELTDDMMSLGLNIFYLGTLESQEITLHDDYGPYKTIFDPCPAGWRVPSSDLWLGFGRISSQSPTPNPAVMDDVNYDPSRSNDYGMYMYLGQNWREGDTSYFPTQGYRLPDGCGWRVGVCGNTVNANTDANDRVNIVHIHNQDKYFNIFETRLVATIKATADPIRCVRDAK